MREVRIIINCDEGFVADTLRDIATAYEDDMEQGWYEAEHGAGSLEFTEAPDPEPSLQEMFDEAAGVAQRKREAEIKRLMDMQHEERIWVEDTFQKLEFLKERGFKVGKYFGGIVDGYPYNYITISKGLRGVEIMGATVRRTDGTIDHVSGQFYNTERLTMEDLIKRIATW